MDKIDRLLDAMEHPDSYSPVEIEAMLRDPEVRDMLDLLDKTKSSLQTIVTPDIDDEWKRFEENHRNYSGFKRNRFTSLFSRNAAASISIGIASFTAVATIVGVGIHQINYSHETKAEEMEVTSESETKATLSDTITPVEEDNVKAFEIVVFDNQPLETILNSIAEYYECNVTFKNEASKSLRLYFRWNKALTVEEVLERLNNFEQIKLTVRDKTIKAD